jgi:hypothetical protein
MKMLLWILFGFAIPCTALWIITEQPPMTPLLVLVLIVVFGVSPVGSFWMLYVAIRYEKNPLPKMLLAFVPFAAFWYYFERVRPGKHNSRVA